MFSSVINGGIVPTMAAFNVHTLHTSISFNDKNIDFQIVLRNIFLTYSTIAQHSCYFLRILDLKSVVYFIFHIAHMGDSIVVITLKTKPCHTVRG